MLILCGNVLVFFTIFLKIIFLGDDLSRDTISPVRSQLQTELSSLHIEQLQQVSSFSGQLLARLADDGFFLANNNTLIQLDGETELSQELHHGVGKLGKRTLLDDKGDGGLAASSSKDATADVGEIVLNFLLVELCEEDAGEAGQELGELPEIGGGGGFGFLAEGEGHDFVVAEEEAGVFAALFAALLEDVGAHVGDGEGVDVGIGLEGSTDVVDKGFLVFTTLGLSFGQGDNLGTTALGHFLFEW